VRVLLDTHTLLWYVLANPQLSATAEATIVDAANEILMSPASYWEIAIKVGSGKFILKQPLEDFVDLCLNRYGFRILPIEPQHAARVATLPQFKHHKDPFDRLLVAQALTEGISILSSDPRLDAYGVTRLW
jgi:PIN domain nuclease of toxin-antitoxin system